MDEETFIRLYIDVTQVSLGERVKQDLFLFSHVKRYRGFIWYIAHIFYVLLSQCLNCAILDAKKVGLTLMHAVQILCSEELHGFAQK